MKVAILSFAFLLIFSLASFSRAADRLNFATEENPPFTFADPGTGEARGIVTQLVQEVARRAGVAIKIDVLPWRRAYQMGLDSPDACVYSTTVTSERKPLFKWVGPLVRDEWVLYGAPGSAITLSSLSDAKGYRIGTYQGDAIDAHLRQEGLNTDAAPQDVLNLKKLSLGRIDLWAAKADLAPRLAQAEGIPDIKPLLTFRRTDLALACNLAVRDEIIARMNDALSAMTLDGTAARIKSAAR